MTDKEREILKLMYDLQIEYAQFQAQQIAGMKRAMAGLREAVEGTAAAIESVERSHAILAKLMKATTDLMGTH
jgi:hypothetical protein